MAADSTTMTVSNYKFAYDFHTGELRLFGPDSQTSLTSEVADALGDFLFEVLTVQGRPPHILPLKITGVE